MTPVQEVRQVVREVEAGHSGWTHVRGDSVGCITDVVFAVETGRDTRGVLRKLILRSRSLMGYGAMTRTLYRDAQGHPRYLLQQHRDALDFSRPTEGQHPASGTTELFVGAAGQLLAQKETGPLKSRTPVRWPQVLAELNAPELFKRYTCHH